MTNPPGEGTPPERPDEPRPGEQQPREQQPWEQQGQQQAQPGQQAYPPYQGQPYPQGYPAQAQYAPNHPRATTALVLGILGLVVCGVIAPFAWSIGKKTVDEIDASQGQLGGRGSAQAGYIMGIIGTVLLIIGLLIGVFVLIATIIGVSTSTSP